MKTYSIDEVLGGDVEWTAESENSYPRKNIVIEQKTSTYSDNSDWKLVPDLSSKSFDKIPAVVERAEEFVSFKWTCLAEIPKRSSKYEEFYEKDKEYEGVPYGQPKDSKTAEYGVWITRKVKNENETNISLSDFCLKAADIESEMYTKYGISESGEYKFPYYSTDCSAFVSYCLDFAWHYDTGGLNSDLPLLIDVPVPYDDTIKDISEKSYSYVNGSNVNIYVAPKKTYLGKSFVVDGITITNPQGGLYYIDNYIKGKIKSSNGIIIRYRCRVPFEIMN